MLFIERRQIVILAAAASMICGFLVFRYLPLRGKIKGAEEAAAAQNVAFTKALGEAGQVPVLKEQLLKLKELVGDYNKKVPAQRDLGAFLQQIAALMNKHSLREQLIQPGAEAEAEGLNCVPVSMQCSGTLEQMFGFFRSLQASERLVRIEQIKLVNDSDFSGEVEMKAEAVIYYRSQGGQGQG